MVNSEQTIKNLEKRINEIKENVEIINLSKKLLQNEFCERIYNRLKELLNDKVYFDNLIVRTGHIVFYLNGLEIVKVFYKFNDWFRSEKKIVTEISYYTTNNIDEKELNRLVSLGKFAKFYLENKESLHKILTEEEATYKLELQPFADKIDKLYTEKYAIEKELILNKRTLLENKLVDGLEINVRIKNIDYTYIKIAKINRSKYVIKATRKVGDVVEFKMNQDELLSYVSK